MLSITISASSEAKGFRKASVTEWSDFLLEDGFWRVGNDLLNVACVYLERVTSFVPSLLSAKIEFEQTKYNILINKAAKAINSTVHKLSISSASKIKISYKDCLHISIYFFILFETINVSNA